MVRDRRRGRRRVAPRTVVRVSLRSLHVARVGRTLGDLAARGAGLFDSPERGRAVSSRDRRSAAQGVAGGRRRGDERTRARPRGLAERNRERDAGGARAGPGTRGPVPSTCWLETPVGEGSSTETTVRIDRPATGGGVGRADDGRVIFVRHSLPGELVRVGVTEATSNFYRGDAVEILESSPDRVTPPCPYAHPGGCGGCDLQHASTSAQLSWKGSLVREHLKRIAGLEMDVEVAPPPAEVQGSRTRLRCAVNEAGRLSLRAARSHQLVPIDSCWIANDAFEPALLSTWRGVSEVEVRALGTAEPFAVARRESERGTHYELRSLTGAPLDPGTHSRVEVGDHVFSVGPLSFWQSHRDAPSVLLDAVLELSTVTSGDDVVDLFSGVRNFAVPLATLVGPSGRVTAVESSAVGVRDARTNATGLKQIGRAHV